MKKITFFSCIISIAFQPGLLAQSLPEVITPQMVQQAKSLTSSQQENLAKQIGVDINTSQVADISDTSSNETSDRFEDYSDDDEEINLSSSSYDQNARFGMSIFQNRVSTFSPIDNLPVPNDYILGPGDQLNIKLLGTENIQLSPIISRDGSIFINQIGDLVLSGLVFDEAVNIIKQRIESALIGVQVFVTMGRIKSINVFISGEVAKPGMYSLSSLATVTQSLYQAGGITRIGSLRNIQVIRDGRLINEFDSYDLLIYGNSANDIRLRSGDVLFVPTYDGIVTIKGNVKRSNSFEIKQSDTFRDLLKWSGGYTANANPAYGHLITHNGLGLLPSSMTLDFNDAKNLDLKLKPDDSFNIPAIGDAISTTIFVSGAVNRPGMLGWFEGMRLSDVFSDINQDFISQSVDLNFGFIERFNTDNFLWEIFHFSPINVISNVSTEVDTILQENDLVHILFNDSRRIQQINSPILKLRDQSSNQQLTKVITIDGAVKYPGQYPIFEDSTLADLFIAAGGFKDDALLSSIEISRTNLVDDGLVDTSIIEISALKGFNESNSFLLQSRDRINVRTVQELNNIDSITLRGEVKYPGSYPLNNNDTLKSIIERAGGLLDSAFPQGAFLQRQTTINAQKEGNAKLAKTIRTSHASSLLTSEEVSNSLSEINAIADIIENAQADGRVLINLDGAMNGDSDSNIRLDPNDNLFIPKTISTVAVIGEVNSTNSSIFNPALDIDDYIALSGGFTPRANVDDIYVIQANGSVKPLTKSLFGFGLSRYKLQPGDTIVVPVKASYLDRLGLWSQVTQIFYQSLVSLAALDRLAD